MRAAIISGVSPVGGTRFGLAPAASSASTVAVPRLVAATHSGVTPRSLVAFTAALDRISSCTSSA